MTDWRVRQEAPEDRASVRAVVRLAFEQDDEADLVDALREDPAWIPDLSTVVEDPGGAVVGHALLTRCHT